MKLSFEEIKSIALGAVECEMVNGAVRLHRFTKEQRDFYNGKHVPYCTSGIKLWFETDSKNLKITVNPYKEYTSRKYFSVDILVNGQPVGHIDNFSDMELPQNYVGITPEIERASGEFALGEGIKSVCVYMPWSVAMEIEEFSLDDGATLKPIKPSKKLIAYGDSITQGYDALRSYNKYVTRLAEALDAEEINKAVGGEVFRTELAKLKDDFNPDYITVAYGTNDLSMRQRDDFEKDCRGFYEAISKNYPDSKIFAITPTWRYYTEPQPLGNIGNVSDFIKEVAEPLPNVTVIDGYDLIPHDRNLYADLRIHPTDQGFEYYFKNLYAKIKEFI